MTGRSERLSILSDAEQEALYGLPDFDDCQRLEYLALSEAELAIVNSRPGVTAQAYCVLQIGYFKAKQAFFRFDLCDVEDDFSFVMSRYFRGESIEQKTISKHERYTQRERITTLFCYQPWAASIMPQLAQQAEQIVRRDVTPGFVATELIVWLNCMDLHLKMVRLAFIGLFRPGLTANSRSIRPALIANKPAFKITDLHSISSRQN